MTEREGKRPPFSCLAFELPCFSGNILARVQLLQHLYSDRRDLHQLFAQVGEPAIFLPVGLKTRFRDFTCLLGEDCRPRWPGMHLTAELVFLSRSLVVDIPVYG